MFEALVESFTRAWHDILARPFGPMSFRFLLQPTMAVIFAIRDGVSDAKFERSPYFWTIVHNRDARRQRLQEGLKSTARLLLLGLGMDLIYQIAQLHAFYPLEALVVVFGLAFVPYLLMRGPVARVVRRWHAHHPPRAAHPKS